jgi:hypothetical protein
MNGCINPLNVELNLICHLLALLGARHILHVSRIRVKVHFYSAWCLHGYDAKPWARAVANQHVWLRSRCIRFSI